MLPDEVLRQIHDELFDWRGSGMSVMEMSHRGSEFRKIFDETEASLRALLGIPKTHSVLFLQGGGHMQFAMVPLNLLGSNTTADYVSTGYWSERAMDDARQFCDVRIAATSKDASFTYAPAPDEWSINQDAAYVHYVSNDTAAGVEFHCTPRVEGVPLVADMSTNLLSCAVDVASHALIYACAQKNVGIAGLTLVIVRNDLLGKARPGTPRMLDYKVHADNGSMFNTPCTFAIYVAGLVLKWIEKSGGLPEMERRHERMSSMVYDFMDSSSLFVNRVRKADRSRINIPIALSEPELEERFVAFAESNGLKHLRGNLALGVRASMYNAMPIEGVEKLVAVMREFERAQA
jgi:phosphoserine aminotransferase